MSAQSVRSKTLGDGTGTLIGGAGETFVLTYEDGNIEWDSPKAELVVVYDRNDIVGSRKGKNQTGTISFTVDLRQFTNSDTANPTIIDVLEESGSSNRAGWVTTGSAAFEQFLTGFKWLVAGIANGDSADHYEQVSKVFWQYKVKEGAIDKIDVTGTILDNTRPTFSGP